MSDFLQRLLGRSRGTVSLAQPSLPARFEDMNVAFEEFTGREERKAAIPPSPLQAAETLLRASTQTDDSRPAERRPAAQATTAQATTENAIPALTEAPFHEQGRARPQGGPVPPLVPEIQQKQGGNTLEVQGVEMQGVELRAGGQWSPPTSLLQASAARKDDVPWTVLPRQGASVAVPGNAALNRPKQPQIAGERAPLGGEARRAVPGDQTSSQAGRQNEDGSQAAIDALRPIEVHIGRIEIVAPAPPPIETAVRLRPPQPALGLTEYLQRRGRGEL